MTNPVTRRLVPLLAVVTSIGFLSGGTSGTAACAAPLQALLVTGHDPHGHPWQDTTPILAGILEDSERFEVEIARLTTPAEAKAFAPDFGGYSIVVLFNHGFDWSPATRERFTDYVREGGGLLVVHNAVGQFPGWEAYRAMIGIGPGGRNYGVRLVFDESKQAIVRVPPGEGVARNGHGRFHEWVVTIRDGEHPITAGLPKVWKHAGDELYHGFRGKPEHLEHLQVLATAFSAKKTGGTGQHEPVMLVNRLGKGRVFHTTLGHNTVSMSCAGFQTTFLRAAEWAATGNVTRTKIPDDFPEPDRSSTASHRIIVIGGMDTHGPGAHDHRAGATMLRKWVDEIINVENLETDLYLDALPKDLERLDGAAAIVLMWEGWDKHLFNAKQPEVLEAFDRWMCRGTGLVTFHAATAVSDSVEDRFLALTGGNKKQNYSTHPMVKNQTLSLATLGHPILMSVAPMTFAEEEFHRKMKFDPSAGKITPILLAMPEEGATKERIVAWTLERRDGARAYVCTGPHFHRSFSNDDFKQLTLNAIIWTAGLEIPDGGVKTKETDR